MEELKHAISESPLETPPTPSKVWLEVTALWPEDDREKFLSRLLEQLPELFAGKPGLTLNMNQTDKVLDALLLGMSGSRRKQVQHAFRRGLSDGNESDLWSVALPAYRLAVEHTRTTLDPMLFAMRDLPNDIEACLLSRLPTLVDEGPEILAGVVLTGAVLWGDIRSPAHLEAIYRCDQFYFEGGVLRARMDYSPDTKWSWFVPEGVQLFLHAFKDRHGLPMSAAVKMEKNAAHGSSKVLQALASTLDLPVATKKALAESPHRLSLARGQTMLPAYLIAYLQRRVTSTSLDDQGWGRFLTGDWLPSDTNVPRQAPPQRSVRTESGPKDDTEDTADGHADEERDEGMLRGTAILNVLESLAVSGSTLTVQDAVTALQGLPTSNWWPIELTLRDWARHHLTHPPQKRWAPSTLLSYFRALRSPLCATVEDFDIQNADDLSLLELFDGALGCVDSEGARHYLTHRLKEFYRYCRDRYPSMARDIDFRELDNAVFSHQAAVRTAFPLERDFRNTVDRLVRKSKFEDMPTRIQCSLLAGALGFRCGLRKTELAHIRVMDFQDGNLPELIVRPSQWGRLKSGQSERRIPLRAFLDESELAVLRTFHSLRTETALPSEALLTDHPVGRPLDGDTLLRPFLDSLRDVSGSRDFCTHSLRHGFANSTLIRFHIADGLELPRTIYALSDARFDKDACLNMVSALIGREAAQPLGFQYLYALAKLLGHLSPQTTLKSYIHVLDLLAHLLRRRIQPAITVEQAAALMGVTYRRLHQVLGRDGVPTRNADVGVFLQIMRKRNGEFPSSIQQNVLQGSDKSAAVRPRKNSASRLRKDSN